MDEGQPDQLPLTQCAEEAAGVFTAAATQSSHGPTGPGRCRTLINHVVYCAELYFTEQTGSW